MPNIITSSLLSINESSDTRVRPNPDLDNFNSELSVGASDAVRMQEDINNIVISTEDGFSKFIFMPWTTSIQLSESYHLSVYVGGYYDSSWFLSPMYDHHTEDPDFNNDIEVGIVLVYRPEQRVVHESKEVYSFKYNDVDATVDALMSLVNKVDEFIEDIKKLPDNEYFVRDFTNLVTSYRFSLPNIKWVPEGSILESIQYVPNTSTDDYEYMHQILSDDDTHGDTYDDIYFTERDGSRIAMKPFYGSVGNETSNIIVIVCGYQSSWDYPGFKLYATIEVPQSYEDISLVITYDTLVVPTDVYDLASSEVKLETMLRMADDILIRYSDFLNKHKDRPINSEVEYLQFFYNLRNDYEYTLREVYVDLDRSY